MACWRSKRRRSVLVVKLGIPALIKEPEKGNCWFEFRISTNGSGKYFAIFAKKHNDFDSSIYKEKNNREMILKLPIKGFLLTLNKKEIQADVLILIYHLHLLWTQIAWNRVQLWDLNSCVPFRPLYENGFKMPITVVRVTLYLYPLGDNHTLRIQYEYKLECVVRMIVDSILPHAESGPNDHRKDAPPVYSNSMCRFR